MGRGHPGPRQGSLLLEKRRTYWKCRTKTNTWNLQERWLARPDRHTRDTQNGPRGAGEERGAGSPTSGEGQREPRACLQKLLCPAHPQVRARGARSRPPPAAEKRGTRGGEGGIGEAPREAALGLGEGPRVPGTQRVSTRPSRPRDGRSERFTGRVTRREQRRRGPPTEPPLFRSVLFCPPSPARLPAAHRAVPPQGCKAASARALPTGRTQGRCWSRFPRERSQRTSMLTGSPGFPPSAPSCAPASLSSMDLTPRTPASRNPLHLNSAGGSPGPMASCAGDEGGGS